MDSQGVPPVVNQGEVVNPPALEFDMEKAAAFKAALEAKQNLVFAMVGGFAAAIIGAIIWAVITVSTQHQIGFMAIGVGFLVGITVRKLGQGISKPFGIVGAAFALLGCVLGNILSACGFVSITANEPFSDVLLTVIANPAAIVDLLTVTLSPMDFLFYAIAMYEGYKFSFREISAEELSSLTRPAEAAA